MAARRRTAAARTEAVARAMAVAPWPRRTPGAFGRWRLSACLCAARAPDVAHVAPDVVPDVVPSTQATPDTAPPVTSWSLRRKAYRS